MNPAGFFQKYLMPTNLPVNLGTDGNIPLEKGYYHGVVYQIPGAEVNINGQWIAFTDENKDLILAQNPMNLEWRLNGKSLDSYGYKPGDTINGQIQVVDDQWNGLNMTKDFSITISDTDHLKGDVNGDGAVDVADIAAVIDYMAGNASIDKEAADVNDDGAVDVADIATIISIMAGATQ